MSLTAVQTQFYDSFGPGYPGQIADMGTAMLSKRIRSFRTDSLVTLGRGVVKGTANGQNDEILTPYAVKMPGVGNVSADIVGIALLNQATTSNASNEPVTVRAQTLVPVAEVGSGDIIFATAPVAIADGDAVWMSITDATIGVGNFSNVTAAGRIQVTGAVWYGAAAAGTVGRIKI